jgi:hypothetical protein
MDKEYQILQMSKKIKTIKRLTDDLIMLNNELPLWEQIDEYQKWLEENGYE